MKIILVLSPRNQGIFYNQNCLAPKNNEPILTEVAPNFIASLKSLLIPIDNLNKLFLSAIYIKNAKCIAGSSFCGGIHIKPIIGNFKSFVQYSKKESISVGNKPLFCVSEPVLT